MERVGDIERRNKEVTFHEAFDTRKKKHAIEDKIVAFDPSISLPRMKFTFRS
jgi:hypothetical protein